MEAQTWLVERRGLFRNTLENAAVSWFVGRYVFMVVSQHIHNSLDNRSHNILDNIIYIRCIGKLVKITRKQASCINVTKTHFIEIMFTNAFTDDRNKDNIGA